MPTPTTQPPAQASSTAGPIPVAAFQACCWIFLVNLALQTYVEPDFGWHLRTGLDLLRTGALPATDPYSHTMPEWPWVEHAWLTDVLIAWCYRGLGPWAVMVLFGAVTLASFLIAGSTARASWTTRLVAIGAALWVARPFLGTRTQVVTLMGFAMLCWMWTGYQRGTRRHLWGLLLLFGLWANLHGGFTGGLVLLALLWGASVVARIVMDRCPSVASHLDEPVLTWLQLRHVAVVGLLAGLITLVNPYGWRLYEEILMSLRDDLMLETLQEWRPVTFGSGAGLAYGVYLAAIAVGIALGIRRREPVRWLVWAVVLAASLLHWRNVFVFLLFSVPLAAEALAGTGERLRRMLGGAWRSIRQGVTAAGTAAAAMLLLFLGSDHAEHLVQAGLQPEAYLATTDYPMEAVQWIKAQPARPGQRLYNEYGHGGFLLWWLPDTPIFIDGRMPAWRIGARRIFEDYLTVTAQAPPSLTVFDKYGVDWAMVGADSPLAMRLERETQWEVVYRDGKVAIFARRLAADGER